MMTFYEFHNGLRLLRSIDLWELDGMPPDQWAKFQENPHDFMIKCDDETAARIWAAMEKRCGVR